MSSRAKSWHPESVQCCSQVQGTKKNNQKQKLKKCYLLLQMEKTVCSTYIFKPPAKKQKKSPSTCFLAEMVKVREGMKAQVREEEKILSVPSSSCPDAGLRSTFPICALSLSRVESRREGAREQDREGERVSNSGVKLSQSVSQVSQAGRQAGRQRGSWWMFLRVCLSDTDNRMRS